MSKQRSGLRMSALLKKVTKITKKIRRDSRKEKIYETGRITFKIPSQLDK